jgi:hypothetical protein
VPRLQASSPPPPPSLSLLLLTPPSLPRAYTDWFGWTLDFTGPQMILTIKLFTFAFDCHDGFSAKKDDSASKDDVRAQVTAAVFPALFYHVTVLQFRISTLPNPLEFLSFVYFFPAFLGGPAFEYRRFADFIEKKYTHTTTTTNPATKAKTSTCVQKSFDGPPPSWLPVLKCFFIGALDCTRSSCHGPLADPPPHTHTHH